MELLIGVIAVGIMLIILYKIYTLDKLIQETLEKVDKATARPRVQLDSPQVNFNSDLEFGGNLNENFEENVNFQGSGLPSSTRRASRIFDINNSINGIEAYMRNLNIMFNGHGNANNFITRLEDEFHVLKIEDNTRVEIASSCLIGNARQWWRYISRPDISWEEFKIELFRQYSNLHSRVAIGRSLLNLKYELGRNFESFVWKYRELYLLWRNNSSESEMIVDLVEQLPSELRLLLQDNENLNLIGLINKVKQYYPWANNNFDLNSNGEPYRQRFGNVINQSYNRNFNRNFNRNMNNGFVNRGARQAGGPSRPSQSNLNSVAGNSRPGS